MKKRVHALLSLTLIEGLGPVKLKRLLEKKGLPTTFLNSFNFSIREEVRGIAISNMADWYRSLLKEVPDLRTLFKEMESKVKEIRIRETLKQIPEKCKLAYIEVSRESQSSLEISRVLRIEMSGIRTRLFLFWRRWGL